MHGSIVLLSEEKVGLLSSCYYYLSFLVAALLVCIPPGYSFVRAGERIDGMDREKCSSLVLLLVVLCRVGNLGFVPLDWVMLAVVKKENKNA